MVLQATHVKEQTINELLAVHGCAACPDRSADMCSHSGCYKSVRTYVLASLQSGSPQIRPLWCGRWQS